MKILKIMVGALMLFMIQSSIYCFGQNTKLLSFQLVDNDQKITVRNGELTIEPAAQKQNAIAQAFIVKQLNNGTALIAYAGQPNLFLKRQGQNSVVLAEYSNSTAFKWRTIYTGNYAQNRSYVSITDLSGVRLLKWNGQRFTMQLEDEPEEAFQEGDRNRKRYKVITVASNTF